MGGSRLEARYCPFIGKYTSHYTTEGRKEGDEGKERGKVMKEWKKELRCS